MKRAWAIGVVLAAVLVPAASARPGAHVKLSVLPLPASVIGSAAQSLPLQPDSGVVAPGADSLNPEGPIGGASKSAWAKLGWISGYALDYGEGASGGSGVTEVRTSVDKYKTSADAKSGLAVLKADDREGPPYARGLRRSGFTIALKKENVAAVGDGRFAFLVSYRAANIAPVFGLNEQFREGRYEAEVTVWAGSAAAATTLAPALAKKLDARIKHALAGKLHAKPVTLPAKPQPGPPPGGPDLTPLALQPSDLSGPATVSQRYTVGPTGLSDLGVLMEPAGQFEALGQDVEWCPTANQASFTADFWLAVQLGTPFPGGTAQLDLASLGDGARGIIANDYYQYTWLAWVVFSSGRLVETLELSGQNAVQASQVQNIAHTVANKINAAGLGS